MVLLLDEKPKRPATGAYRCRDCGAEVTADTFHPIEACALVIALRLLGAADSEEGVTK